MPSAKGKNARGTQETMISSGSDGEDGENSGSRRSRAAIEEAGADDEGDDGEEEDEAEELPRRSSGYKSEEESPRLKREDLAPALIKWLLEEERSLLTKID